MTISDADIAKVSEATDIVALFSERTPIKKYGRDYKCCCPFHNEKTPSCVVNPSLQLWHCFGCGEGGNVFTYVMKLEGLSFPEAVHRLAERAHIEIKDTAQGRGNFVGTATKNKLREVCKETAMFYHMQLMRSKDAACANARSYLSTRKLGGSVPKTWQLGFAPGRSSLVHHLQAKGYSADEMLKANVAVNNKSGKLADRFFNRVMFPINDEAGECIAFGGRVIGSGEPKYLNSQETPIFHKSKTLFGLDKAKITMTNTGVAVVCEGYTDVIAMHEAGITNAVATLGTALGKSHIRLLMRHARHKIVYLFDGDAAGQRAAERALQFIDSSITPEAGSTQTQLFAVELPDNLDPAEFLDKHSAEEMQKLIANAMPLLEFGIERRIAKWDIQTPEGRTGAAADALSVLAPIKDSLLAKDYALKIAGTCRIREADALNTLANLKPPKTYDYSNNSTAQTQQNATEPASKPLTVKLTKKEVNRIRIERKLLSLLAANTNILLENSGALSQIQWQDSHASKIATLMLDEIASGAAISTSNIINKASQASELAPKILSAATQNNSGETNALAAFLIEDLLIDDAEETILEMRQQLANTNDAAASKELFEAIAAMQKSLLARKQAHAQMQAR